MSSHPFDSLHPRRPSFLPPPHPLARPPYPENPNVSRNCHRYVPYTSHSSMGHSLPHHLPPHPPEMYSFNRAPVLMPPPYCRPYESNYTLVNLTHRFDDGPLRSQQRVMETPNFRHFNGAPCTPHVPNGGIVFCSPQNWNPRFTSPDPCRLPFCNHVPNATSDRDVLSGHSVPYPARTTQQIGESRRDSKERCWRHPEDYKVNTGWEKRTYLLKDEADCSEFPDRGKKSELPFYMTSHGFDSDKAEACKVPAVRKTESQLLSSARVDSLEGSHQLVRARKKSTVPENKNHESCEVKAGGGYKSRGTSKIESQLVSTTRVDSSSGDTYKLIRDGKKSTVIKNKCREFSEVEGGGSHGSKFVDHGKKYLLSSSDQESLLSEVDDCDGHKSRGVPKAGNRSLSSARVDSSPRKGRKLIWDRKIPTVAEGGSHGCDEAAKGMGNASKFLEHGRGPVLISSHRESHIFGSNDSEGSKVAVISEIGSHSLCSEGIDSSRVESHRSVPDRNNSTIIENARHKGSDDKDGGDVSKFLDDGEKPTSNSFYKESEGISETGNQLLSGAGADSSPRESNNEFSKADEHAQYSSKSMLHVEKAVKFKIKSRGGKGRNPIIHRKNSQGKGDSGSLKKFFPAISPASPEIKSSEANACRSLGSNEHEGNERNSVDHDACFRSNDFVVNPVTGQSCSSPLFDGTVTVTDGKTQISTKDFENSLPVTSSQRKGDVTGSVAGSVDLADDCVNGEQQNSTSRACSPIPSALLEGSILLEGSEVPGAFSFDAVANGIESDKDLGEHDTFKPHSPPILQCEEVMHLSSTEKILSFGSVAALALGDHVDYVRGKKSADEGTFTEGGVSDSSHAECGEASVLPTTCSLKTCGPSLNGGTLGYYLPESSNPSKSGSLFNATISHTECTEKIGIQLPQNLESFRVENESEIRLSGVDSEECRISEGLPCVPPELHVSEHGAAVPLPDSGVKFGKTSINMLHREIPSSEACCINVEVSSKDVVCVESESTYADDRVSGGLASEEENMKRSSWTEGSNCCASPECENSEMYKKCIKCRAVIVSDTMSMVCSMCSILSHDFSTVVDTDPRVSMRTVTVDEGQSPATWPQMSGCMDTGPQIVPVRAASSDNRSHKVKNALLSEFRSALKAFLNGESQNIYSGSSEKEESRGKESVDMDDSVISSSPTSERKMQFPEDAQNMQKNDEGGTLPSEKIITSEKLFKKGISDVCRTERDSGQQPKDRNGESSHRSTHEIHGRIRRTRWREITGVQAPMLPQSLCKGRDDESSCQSSHSREETHSRFGRAHRPKNTGVQAPVYAQSPRKRRNGQSFRQSVRCREGSRDRPNLVAKRQKTTGTQSPARPQSPCKDKKGESLQQSASSREESHGRTRTDKKKDEDDRSPRRSAREKSRDSIQESIGDVRSPRHGQRRKCGNRNGESLEQAARSEEESRDRIQMVQRQKIVDTRSPTSAQSQCKDGNGEERHDEHHLSAHDGRRPSNEEEGRGGAPSAHNPEEPASAAAAPHDLSGDASKGVPSSYGTVPPRASEAVTSEDDASRTARSLPQPPPSLVARSSNVQNSTPHHHHSIAWRHHLMAASAVSRLRILPKSAPQSRTWHRVSVPSDPANEQTLPASRQQQSPKKSGKLPPAAAAATTYMRKGNCLVRKTPSHGSDADRLVVPTEKPKESDDAASSQVHPLIDPEDRSTVVKNAIVPEDAAVSDGPATVSGNLARTESSRTGDDHGGTSRITYVKRKSYQLVAELGLPAAADKTENAQTADGYYKRSKHQLIRTAGDAETKQGACSSGMPTNGRPCVRGKKKKASQFSLVWRLGDLRDPKRESASRRHVLHWKWRGSFVRRAYWGSQRPSSRKDESAGGSHLKWDRGLKSGGREATMVAEAEGRRRRRRGAAAEPEYVRMRNGNQLVRASASPLKRWCRVLASEKVRWSLHTVRSRSLRKRKYCQFYTRFGKCGKQEDGKCPYIHDSSKVVVCTRFLNGLCTKPGCRLTHQVIPERMQDCSYFLRGMLRVSFHSRCAVFSFASQDCALTRIARTGT